MEVRCSLRRARRKISLAFLWRQGERAVLMKAKLILSPPLIFLFLGMLVCPSIVAATQGDSPSSPAPAGIPFLAMIECGEGYTSQELYDMKIILVEVLRGERAWDLLKGASPANKPPKTGFDYILVRVKLELSARSPGRGCSHELRPEQFSAFSADGKEYEAPSVVIPKPDLSGSLRSGEFFEGWKVFLVPQGDSKPLMAYDPASGGGMSRGKIVWFQLF
jgi:hypothetical protein